MARELDHPSRRGEGALFFSSSHTITETVSYPRLAAGLNGRSSMLISFRRGLNALTRRWSFQATLLVLRSSLDQSKYARVSMLLPSWLVSPLDGVVAMLVLLRPWTSTALDLDI